MVQLDIVYQGLAGLYAGTYLQPNYIWLACTDNARICKSTLLCLRQERLQLLFHLLGQ